MQAVAIDYCRCYKKLFSENIIISVSFGEKAVREEIGEAVPKYGNIKRNREDIGVVNVLNISNMLFTSEGYHGKKRSSLTSINLVVDKNLQMTDLLWSGVHLRLPFRLIPFRFCHKGNAEAISTMIKRCTREQKFHFFQSRPMASLPKKKNSEKIPPLRRK